MKANELIIGDWLQYKGQFNAFTFRVEQITKRKVGYHAEPCENRIHYLRLSECQPIPLTPEILERNGFRLFDEADKTYHLEYADGIYAQADFKADEPYVYVSNRCYFACPYCKHVHELQHALRQCRIEKEIEL